MTGLHFAADSIGLSSLNFFLVGSGIFVYFGERGVSVVQGNPRSMNLVPIESAYRFPISNFGDVPVSPDRPCWGPPAHKP